MSNPQQSPATPIGIRRGDDLAKLQKKLQRSYQEKNMLLAEIQTLKQHARAPGGGDESIGDKDDWNRLLEANIRSGTMTCMWIIKAQIIKILAGGFHKWKLNTYVRRDGTDSTRILRPPRLVTNSPSRTAAKPLSSPLSPEQARRKRLLDMALGIISAKPIYPLVGGAHTDPKPIRNLSASSLQSSEFARNAAPLSGPPSLNSRLTSSTTQKRSQSPLQSSYAEFLYSTRRASLRRRSASSSPPPSPRRRSFSRGSSPTSRPKPSFMLPTHSSRKKNGQNATPPAGKTHFVAGATSAQPRMRSASREPVARSEASTSKPPAPAWTNERQKASRPNSAPSSSDPSRRQARLDRDVEEQYSRLLANISQPDNTLSDRTEGSPGDGHDDESSLALSESMHVQDVSMGVIHLHRSGLGGARITRVQSNQQPYSAAKGNGPALHSARTRPQSSGQKGIDKAQLRLFHDDLTDKHGAGAWSSNLRGGLLKAVPRKKPIRI